MTEKHTTRTAGGHKRLATYLCLATAPGRNCGTLTAPEQDGQRQLIQSLPNAKRANGLRAEYARRYLDCLERRRPQLIALLHRMRFSREVAEDAAQEAIIKALELIEAEAVESLGNRWSWLIGVARNKARTIRRRQGRWLTLDPDVPAARPRAVSGDDDEPVHFALARAAFGRLPSHVQELFAYVYLEGNSYRQAATHFQVGLGVVSRRLRDARESLRSDLRSLPQFCAPPGQTSKATD